jgi:hypothetical protein
LCREGQRGATAQSRSVADPAHLLIWFYGREGSQENGFSQEIGISARSREKPGAGTFDVARCQRRVARRLAKLESLVSQGTSVSIDICSLRKTHAGHSLHAFVRLLVRGFHRLFVVQKEYE